MSQEHRSEIIRALGRLADAKSQTPTDGSFGVYARYLAPYPMEMIDAAIDALALSTNPHYPPVGLIVAEMARLLRGQVGDTGRSPILSAEEAWQKARATIAAYQPQTRPQPLSDNPAIDNALRALGGARACQWVDAVGEGIVKRSFLAEYERQVSTPQHIAWALAGGALVPPVVPGLELPEYEIARLAAEARREGRDLPAPFAALAEGKPERAAVLDGDAPAYPFALPAPLAESLTDERRAEIAGDFHGNITRIVDRMQLPVVDRDVSEGEIERRFAEHGLRVRRDESGRLEITKIQEAR